MPKHATSKPNNTTHEAAYSTGSAAKMFGVTNKTILSWINQGKVSAFRTPGGHYRINESEIEKLKENKDGDSVVVGFE